MKFALLNLAAIDDPTIRRMEEALNLSAADCMSRFDGLSISVEYKEGAQDAPDGYIALAAFKDPDVQGVYGYHFRDKLGRAYGRGFRSIIPNDCLLHDPSGAGEALLTTLDHEMKEIAKDKWASFWSDGPFFDPSTNRSWAEVAVEVCDPVQGNAYERVLRDGSKVSLSNFITEDWFDGDSKGGEYDFMKVLAAPLTIAKGGYVIVRDGPASEQGQVEGDVPLWRIAHRGLPGAHSGHRKRRPPLLPPIAAPRSTGFCP